MYKPTFLLIFSVLSLLLYYSLEYFTNSSQPFYTFYGTRRLELKDTKHSINDAVEEIEKGILESFPSFIREKVARNLQKTDQWGTCLPWINWYVGNTACPYRISSSTKKRTFRLPDAIGIGVGKAGTGSLAFLDCHPNVVFRAYEPDVYPMSEYGELLKFKTDEAITKARENAYTTRCGKNSRFSETELLQTISHSIPMAAEDEFLIEKTPMYSERRCRKKTEESCTLIRAQQMKAINPKVKIFMFITDPVERIVSHLKMIIRLAHERMRPSKPKDPVLYRTLREHLAEINKLAVKMQNTTDSSLIDTYITSLENKLQDSGTKLKDTLLLSGLDKSNNWAEEKANIQNQITYSTLLDKGNYYSVLKDFDSVLGRDQVHVVDGQAVKKSLNSEFDQLLEFFGMPTGLMKFKLDDQKGFYCLEKPVMYCLGENKGVTQKYKSFYDAFPELHILQKAYSNEMYSTFGFIFNCDSKQECCSVQTQRFSWLQNYFC